MLIRSADRNQRANLQTIAKDNGPGLRSAFVPEVIEAMRKGEIRLLSKPHPHQIETLASQGARVALTRAFKRQQSNDLHWQRQRQAFKDTPSDFETDFQELAQAKSKRSAGQMRRWQRWRQAIRSGEVPVDARVHSEESRQKQSTAARQRLSRVEWTPEKREEKRRMGAIGLEKQRRARTAKRP